MIPVQADIEQGDCIRRDPAPYEPITYHVPLDADLQQYTAEMCDLYEVPLELAYAVMQVESGYTVSATSSTGDYGLMQINSINTSKSSRSFTRLDEDEEKEAHDKEVYIERIDAKVQREERLPGTSVETSTTTESSYLIVERLERLLTDVQRQKSKVIQQLADLRRMSNSGKNELVDDWVAAVEAADAEVEGEDDGAETT